MAKKESKQKKITVRVDFTHGRYADASYHILHALYHFEQTSDNGADHAE